MLTTTSDAISSSTKCYYYCLKEWNSMQCNEIENENENKKIEMT